MGVTAGAAVALVLLTGCSDPGTETASTSSAATAPAVSSAPSPSSPVVTPGPTPTVTLPPGLNRADVAAGLRSAAFSTSGSGTLVTVPGNVKAASQQGRRVRIKVQVEKGLRIDGQRYARFVLATLNDPRSWGHGGSRHFDRVDGDYDIRVVLASPKTSASMCLPLRTFGKLSCHSGDAAVLTVYRWVKAIPDYGSNRTGYRQYLVNHEVGHALGHGHEFCPGKGRIAPVMQQQTKSLQGCRINPWPYP